MISSGLSSDVFSRVAKKRLVQIGLLASIVLAGVFGWYFYRLNSNTIYVSGVGNVSIASSDLETSERALAAAKRALQESNSELAIGIMKKYLDRHPRDREHRVLFASLYQHLEKPEEAVRLLKYGMNGSVADSSLWEAVRRIRVAQAEQGPNTTVVGHWERTSPSVDEEQDKKWITQHWELALEAAQEVEKKQPKDTSNRWYLAKILGELGRLPESIVYWSALYEESPLDSDVAVGYATALLESQEWEKVEPVLWKHAKSTTARAKVYSLLCKLYTEKNDHERLKEVEKHSSFYQSIPDFVEIEYSLDHLNTLRTLYEEETLERLMLDKSRSSSMFLATLCWQHPHNRDEEDAFAELERRGEDAIDIVDQLMNNASSNCTIRSCAKILARKKFPGLIERLIGLLPHDHMSFGMDMDIAGAMDELGDPLAIDSLIECARISDRSIPDHGGDMGSFLQDDICSRARSVLALGAFDQPEARDALKKGFENPRLRACSAAALYRLTRDDTYLQVIQDDRTETRYRYDLVRYLKRLNEPYADRIVGMIEAELEARRAQ